MNIRAMKRAKISGADGEDARYAQVGALCWRRDGATRQVLLITSRDTHRWIIPKGWPMKGKSDECAASQEAWEEAGVKARNLSHEPIGCYEYDKRLDGESNARCQVQVYAMEAAEFREKFPESGERRRLWVSAKDAATMVQEPALRDLLLSF